MVENGVASKAAVYTGVGAGIGAAMGAARTKFMKEGSSELLKAFHMDTFESVQNFIKDKNNKSLSAIFTNGKSIDITKDKLAKLADSAFKTTKKTYLKNAAIIGGICAAAGGLYALITSKKKD